MPPDQNPNAWLCSNTEGRFLVQFPSACHVGCTNLSLPANRLVDLQTKPLADLPTSLQPTVASLPANPSWSLQLTLPILVNLRLPPLLLLRLPPRHILPHPHLTLDPLSRPENLTLQVKAPPLLRVIYIKQALKALHDLLHIRLPVLRRLDI
jgi:hypothetical protein